MRTETQTIVVGASISGLATAGSLSRQGLECIVLEKDAHVGTPWRNHYERLHLHTNKRVSNLPYKKFDRSVPRYPSRQEVIRYLEAYRDAFHIEPHFNTEVKSVSREQGYWITRTDSGTYQSKYLVMATGPFGKPRPVSFRGSDSFPGKILHSYDYKTGRDFQGKHVLVVGFGNSACEIALDLYEQGADPAMAVRSPVNVIPRDLLGIPILEISLLLSHFSPGLADALSAPVMWLSFGNLRRLGLRKKTYGPFSEIRRDGTTPVLDIGTMSHIRKGHIKIYGEIDHFEGKSVHFKDGIAKNFDAVIAAIGYYRDYAQIVQVGQDRFDDLKVPVGRQKYFGLDGLYFCGYWVGPTGQIREIGRDALKIAKHIANKEKFS